MVRRLSAAGAVGEAPVTIDRATPAHAAELAEFAARAFVEAFGEQNRPDDIRAHVQETFGPRRQAAQIANPGIRTLVATSADRLIGYVQVRHGPAPACVPGPAPVELWRFYLDRAWHGRGIADALMESARDAARELAGRTLWLSVWERNGRAIAFYQKSGFHVVGTHPFRVGADWQTDYIMVALVAPPVTAANG